jgi:hypothetical protein
VRVLRFGDQTPGERARLDLPAGRAPPQGALLSVVVEIERPRPEEDGFDEAGYLRRQGVHVILTASTFRIVGHRGGLGGLADRVRGAIAASLAPGVSGERRAVIAAVVLGEDEGLSPELRDRFRASGLYHLLRESRQAITVVVPNGCLHEIACESLPRWKATSTRMQGVRALKVYAVKVMSQYMNRRKTRERTTAPRGVPYPAGDR